MSVSKFFPNLSDNFISDIDELKKVIYANAEAKGFWDFEKVTGISLGVVIATKLALVHSELSEALEAIRTKKTTDDKLPGFDPLTVEIADTIIRLLDICGRYNLDIAEAILTKHGFNTARERLHGKVI